jgi:eukaryotic-like serine/threonine-protein kinase
MTAEPRTVLDDRYALDELIARGGMADVYRGTDQVLLRPVAIKVLRELTDPVKRDRFVAEAKTLASLNHPGLITLLDAGIMVDRPYLVMELATGSTLSACISSGPMDPERVRLIGQQLAAALAYAHAEGVVHRDVKPSNVLVCDDDRIVLADFGIARLIGGAQHHTKSGEAIGSPPYVAPEQVASEPIGPRADVFSLGLVLLEALTGERAYTGTPIEAAVARLHAPPTIPTHLDRGWRELIPRMTDRDPANRPTAEQVAAELAAPSFGRSPVVSEDSLADTGELKLPVEGRRGTSPSEPSRKSPPPRGSRRRLRASIAAGMVVVAAVVGTLVLAPWDQAQTTDPDPTIPPGVPSRMQQPLDDLHRAVEGRQP